MKYINLGKEQKKVSKIILGTWAIGGSYWGKYDEAAAIGAIESAINNGINFIDTAPAYGDGHSEQLIGQVIKKRRDEIFLATKCGLDKEKGYASNLSPEFIQKDLHNSLKNLQTDHIDLYQCHWPDQNSSLEKTMRALLKFQKEGKITNIGVSNFSKKELEKSLSYTEIITHQPQYSLVDRSIEEELLPFCIKKKVGIICYGPLGGGVLTGKYKEWPQFDNHDARTFFYQAFQKKNWPKTMELVELVKELAKKHSVTPGQIAIAWTLAQKGVIGAIVGAKNTKQVLENAQAANVKLTPEDLVLLDEKSKDLYAPIRR